MSKFVQFFATERGRKTSGVLMVAAVASGVLAKYLPNSVLLEQTREVLQLYRNGFPVPVPANVLSRVDQVKKDMKLDEETSKRVTPFTIFGFEIMSVGSTQYPTGTLLGIPINFSYETADDIDKKNIQVGNKTVHWTAPDGMALASSLVLSDAAQKFAIARDIAHSSTHHITTHAALNGGSILTLYYLSYQFNRKAKLFTRPLKLRVVLYSLLGGIVGTIWLFMKDFTTYHSELQADEEAAAISEEYARGAVEFYNKTLQRNVALRSLLNSEGPKSYTAAGNLKETFRTKHVPFVVRRDNALARLKVPDVKPGVEAV